MIRRPPRSTRTDTLFPYTTLFRSLVNNVTLGIAPTWKDFFIAIPLGMIAYTGIETISNMAEEAKDERTTIPAAIARVRRSEEHTSELQSLMRISYAVFCLKKKKKRKHLHT